MDVFKFRVWDKENQNMSYTDEDLVLCFSSDGINAIDYTNHNSYRIGVDNLNIMQYTGLKDKQGKDIYEGDIIDKGYHNLSTEDRIGYVHFSDGGDSDGWAHGDWLGWITNNHDSLLDVHEECSILGNIYENPDLLEKC